MTKKQGIRAVVFIVLLSVIILAIGAAIPSAQTADVVLMKRRFDEMREDPENTWDGVWLGTSVADRAWAAPLAWEKHGMAVYPMSTDGQPFVLSTSLLEEIRRYHDISFVVVELHGLRPATMKTNGARIRWITENIRSLRIKMEATTKALAYMDKWYPGAFDESAVSRLSYYFPLLKFHSRLTKDQFYRGDIDSGETEMKGAYNAARHIYANPVTPTVDTEPASLTDQQKELIDELCDYAEKEGLSLVFVNTPSELKKEAAAAINAAAGYVEELGYPVLNFDDSVVLAESGISGAEDFIDQKHLNTAGAHKFTDYVSAWLAEQLEIRDHRGDEAYKSWEEALEKYRPFYEQSLEETARWKREKFGQ